MQQNHTAPEKPFQAPKCESMHRPKNHRNPDVFIIVIEGCEERLINFLQFLTYPIWSIKEVIQQILCSP
ncbi:hypothetical protein CMK12_00955 [Candidatus Poribacteria bacterium]|nr:hypothetical protein [Candidatus Poribacteria bacterium]